MAAHEKLKVGGCEVELDWSGASEFWLSVDNTDYYSSPVSMTLDPIEARRLAVALIRMADKVEGGDPNVAGRIGGLSDKLEDLSLVRLRKQCALR